MYYISIANWFVIIGHLLHTFIYQSKRYIINGVLQPSICDKNTVLRKYIKNGFAMPFVYVWLLYFTRDFYLATTLILKIDTIHYFIWFEHCYNYLPRPFNILKQFVRFTDSGFIASMIYYVYPPFFPIAHNVQFVITTGYWYGKLVLHIQDADNISNPEIIKWYENIWTYMNHLVPYVILLYNRYITAPENQVCTTYFSGYDLLYSYAWLHGWFLYIYIPWRALTNDSVYNIFDTNVSFTHKAIYIVVIHIIMLIGHGIGYITTNIM